VFQVRLAIQILRLNVGDTFWQGAGHHQHVAWEKLIFGNLDEAADLDIEGFYVAEGRVATRAALNDLLILLIVLLATLVVLKSVLDHGDTHDEAERHEGGGGSVEILQARHQLQDRHE